MGCVYMATNKANGKRYVGKTVGTVESRRRSHELSADGGSSLYFHRALRKYGFDAFGWRELFDDADEEDLDSVERAMIRLLKTRVPSGYNLTDGGSNGRHSALTRIKISNKAKGRVAWNKGIPHSAETKDKIRAKALGRTAWNKGMPSGATTVPVGCTFKGRKHSPEEVVRCKKFAKERPRDAKGLFLPKQGVIGG